DLHVPQPRHDSEREQQDHDHQVALPVATGTGRARFDRGRGDEGVGLLRLFRSRKPAHFSRYLDRKEKMAMSATRAARAAEAVLPVNATPVLCAARAICFCWISATFVLSVLNSTPHCSFWDVTALSNRSPCISTVFVSRSRSAENCLTTAETASLSSARVFEVTPAITASIS